LTLKAVADQVAAAQAARAEKKATKKANAAVKGIDKAAAPEPAAAAEPEPAAAPAPSPSAWGEITPKTVKALRDATGAGMMDCKKAVIESDGDQEAAAEFLRAKGLAKAD